MMFSRIDDNVCAHCMELLENNRIEAIKCYRNFDMEGEPCDIQISDILTRIFFIPWKEFYSQSNESKTGDAKIFCSDIESSKADNEVLPIPICDRCEPSFVELYKSYNTFEKLAKPKSLIRRARDFVLQKIPTYHAKGKQSKSEEEDLFDDFQFNEDRITDSDLDVVEIESKYEPWQSHEYNTDVPTIQNEEKTLVVKLEKMSEGTLLSYKSTTKTRSKKKKKRKITSQQKKVDATENTEKSIYKCSFCDKTFGSRKPLTAHKKTHPEYLQLKSQRTLRGPFPCEICGKIFAALKFLKRHQMRHDTSRSVECDKCGKVLRCEEYYKLHLINVHGSDEEKMRKRSPCHICGKLVVIMSAHMMAMHTKEKEKFDCNQCDKVFPTVEKLELHVKAHESTTTFKCSVCNKEFPIEEYLTEHHEKHHSVEKPYGCHLCPKRFHLSKELRYHMPTHSSEKAYVCEHCGNEYKNIKTLNKHLKNHADEELQDPEAFKCNECGKSFKNGMSLRVHKGRFHRTDLVLSKKIHECSICGKRLYDELNLKKHEAIHYKKSTL